MDTDTALVHEVLLAEPRGFCAGVDRAIEIVERALTRFGAPVYVRHEIVHNTYVVNDLKSRGAKDAEAQVSPSTFEPAATERVAMGLIVGELVQANQLQATPEQVRAFAEKGLSQARDNYARFKDAAEAQNDAMEEMFTVASRGASEYAAKVMEFLKVNTNSAFDFAQDLLTVRSPTETLELWTAYVRKSFETYAAQAKELVELGQKVATQTAEPIQASAARYFRAA